MKLSCASFDPSEKFVGWFSPTQTPAQKFKLGFSVFSSHEIASGLISFEMIFEALLFKLSRLMFHLLNSKILGILGFNLAMDHWQWHPCCSYKGTSNKKWQVMNISTCITEQPFRSKWDYISRNSQLNIELLRKSCVFFIDSKIWNAQLKNEFKNYMFKSCPTTKRFNQLLFVQILNFKIAMLKGLTPLNFQERVPFQSIEIVQFNQLNFYLSSMI